MLSIINFILLIVLGVAYFKKHYVILSADEYNNIADYVEQTQQDSKQQELAGGTGIEVGYNADYLIEENE